MTWSKAKPLQKDINVLHAELGHYSKVITWATGRAMGLNIIGIFKHCEDCTLGMAKKSGQ